ncbi:interleukin-12 receptor subunit beta-2 [Xyrichtys novacula]|uniref:Interleukin-12 receptor subunit beta-2 n=1 Tax=Xyrichtys novacula TaxID=13765 RepID=A0AAV1FGZ5_XYRNO|nr:interleukin-12 receptor subunit beta-2 [Xyrichtys novacula]
MSRTWSTFIAVALLAVQLCTGQKVCDIWSSAGSVVQRGSSFRVYCTFACKNLGKIYSSHPPTAQSYEKLNSSTIYHNVVDINNTRTFSCQSSCRHEGEPCGVDIKSGYLPEQPKNLSCSYNVRNNESGVVLCTWKTGRDTHLQNSSILWVRTVSENHTAGPEAFKVSGKGGDSLSTSFTRSSSVRMISVWVQVKNELGSSASAPVNYTLRDIAMPSAPVLGQPECSSRKCTIRVEQLVRTPYLEIEYRAEAQTWVSSPFSVMQMGQTQVLSISSLEPYRLYHFRARSRFSSGVWSQWSRDISGWTQEEAPAKELDVWYTEASSDATSLQVYWKEPTFSDARGKIICYKVSVYNQRSNMLAANISAGVRNYTVPFCADCEVIVWVCNSIGCSPPSKITAKNKKAKLLQDVKVTADNHSVAISWTKLRTTTVAAEYVVEWYPEGQKLEQLRWTRLEKNANHCVITDLKPAECYEGAVYIHHNDGSVGQNRFTGVISESVPTAGPSVQENVDGNEVKVTWTEIPRGQRGGCITKYTIYLENSGGHQQHYSVLASKWTHTVQGLSPDVYSLWVTASTAKGEGPAGQKVKFYIKQETQYLLIVFVLILVITLFLLCLWQCSAVKQRFWGVFKCLKLDADLDPANSKWAKECTQEKGRMNLQLPQSDCSVAQEEEEPILVNIEELPNQSSEIRSPSDDSSQVPPETSLSPLTEQTTQLYPLTTYIKSFSHDSDSSDHTQSSMDTNSTVDYISSHRQGGSDEDDQEEEDFLEMDGFFPSHNIFMVPQGFGGKLTLDAVKINCTDFFQNS